MKILLTSNRFHPDVGGIETITDILANQFVRVGHDVRVLTQTKANDSCDNQFRFNVLRNPGIIKLIRNYYWADVVIQNNLEVRQLWPLLLIRRPLVVGLQTWIRTARGKRNILQKIKLIVLHASNEVIACSEAIKQDCISRASVIGNPYDSELFHGMPSVAREQAIGFVGRLVSDKGADMLIKAFSTLRPANWQLSIIGDGPERTSLENLAVELGVDKQVTFTGVLKGQALAATLNRHEILVVPSCWPEPFGIVALEGLACGCVVLASDGGGLPDAVGSAGILFRRGDQKDLERQLNYLIKNQSARQHLRNRTTKHLENYRQEFVSNRYLSILERVYSRKRKAKEFAR
jgi:glycosyltransferase involved in cell wall biosynthesis